MPKRSPRNQNKHDLKVKQIVRQLEKEDWKVKADLEGHNKPDSIGKEGYIPDIQAEKKGSTRIIEVETNDTLEKDKNQHAAFRRSAAHKKKTTFKIEVT